MLQNGNLIGSSLAVSYSNENKKTASITCNRRKSIQRWNAKQGRIFSKYYWGVGGLSNVTQQMNYFAEKHQLSM